MQYGRAIQEFIAIRASELYDLIRRAGWHWPFRIRVFESGEIGWQIDDQFYGELRLEAVIGDLPEAVELARQMQDVPQAPPLWPKGRDILRSYEGIGVGTRSGVLTNACLQDLVWAYLEDQGPRLEPYPRIRWASSLRRWLGNWLPERDILAGLVEIRVAWERSCPGRLAAAGRDG